MRNRIWAGNVRNTDDRVEVRYFVDDDELMVNRYTEDGLEDAVKIEDRTSKADCRIWVVTFDNHDQLLINWWTNEDEVTVAYRPIFGSSWHAPAILSDADKDAA
jgi:hypothetical protein